MSERDGGGKVYIGRERRHQGPPRTCNRRPRVIDYGKKGGTSQIPISEQNSVGGGNIAGHSCLLF